jgi:hypothetical protein
MWSWSFLMIVHAHGHEHDLGVDVGEMRPMRSDGRDYEVAGLSSGAFAAAVPRTDARD